VAQTTSNPVVLLVKPNQIQVHELKPLPNKAKVQGMVAMRQHPSPGDPVSTVALKLPFFTSIKSIPIFVSIESMHTMYM
jgi:hypothetical protein